jgi:hypothetical protein
MRPRGAAGVALLHAAMLAAAQPAGAVVLGGPSALSIYTVRLVGNGNCTGVAIARRAVITDCLDPGFGDDDHLPIKKNATKSRP